MNDLINQIIKNNGRVVFVSPHLDDAIFSCGGLISELTKKTDVKIINVFTSGDNLLTLSAKKFLEQCAYKNQETLYKDRVEEDREVFSTLKIKPINMGLEDALFRKKSNPNFIEKLLGKKIPEFLHLYPVYRLHIVKGGISKKDADTFEKIQKEIEKLNLGKNDYLFAPYGIGGHVDHRIVSNVAKKFTNTTNVVLWADYPYITRSKIELNNLISYKPDWKIKEILFKGYKSQYNAVIGSTLEKVDEYYNCLKAQENTRLSLNMTTRSLKLLFISPKNFLYRLMIPNKKVVIINDIDPKAVELGKDVKSKIQNLVPELIVHFVGSTALGIPGQNDVDILIESDSNNFAEYTTKLDKFLGKPFKVHKKFIEWKKIINKIPVEVIMVDPKTKKYNELMDIFNLFNSNKTVLNEYRRLKTEANGIPEREYELRKLEFFNRVLGYNKKPFILLGKLLITFIVVSLMFLSIRGRLGNPNENDLNLLKWRDNGPFELSPERGRFALTYSFVENKSVYFSLTLAKFIVPDLGYKNGHYVSLFAPAVSFIVMVGYVAGKYFGASQIGSFGVIAFFGLINTLLIQKIAKESGANKTVSILAGLVFLFATPAFAYAVNLYQHHISTFLILLSVYLLIKYNNFWSISTIWFLCAMSIPVDYPNLILMLPIGIFAITKFFTVEKLREKIKISLKTIYIFTFLSVIIPMGFFFWFNQKSYGNPMQFSGTIGSVRAIDSNGLPTIPKTQDPREVENFLKPEEQKKSAIAFFKPRNLINGFYIHLFSPDRGIVTFTPVILLGIIGIFILYKDKNKYLSVLLGIIGANILLYSMWGDPWGGWAFGSRYMIPSYAILAILLGVTLSKLGKKWWFVIPFWLLMTYSICVNTLGALTTSANPPQAESLALEKLSGKQERYSYDRNWEFLSSSGSKSFVYNTWANKYVSPVEYYYLIAGSIVLISTGLLAAMILNKHYEN